MDNETKTTEEKLLMLALYANVFDSIVKNDKELKNVAHLLDMTESDAQQIIALLWKDSATQYETYLHQHKEQLSKAEDAEDESCGRSHVNLADDVPGWSNGIFHFIILLASGLTMLFLVQPYDLSLVLKMVLLIPALFCGYAIGIALVALVLGFTDHGGDQ